MLKNVLSFLDRTSIVLQVERIDLEYVTQDSLSSTLYIGKSFVTNLGWVRIYFIINILG